LNVISAEKERISTLQNELDGKRTIIIFWMSMAAVGWIGAATCFALWMISSK
jgi:hypothetical protein